MTDLLVSKCLFVFFKTFWTFLLTTISEPNRWEDGVRAKVQPIEAHSEILIERDSFSNDK